MSFTNKQVMMLGQITKLISTTSQQVINEGKVIRLAIVVSTFLRKHLLLSLNKTHIIVLYIYDRKTYAVLIDSLW